MSQPAHLSSCRVRPLHETPGHIFTSFQTASVKQGTGGSRCSTIRMLFYAYGDLWRGTFGIDYTCSDSALGGMIQVNICCWRRHRVLTKWSSLYAPGSLTSDTLPTALPKANQTQLWRKGCYNFNCVRLLLSCREYSRMHVPLARVFDASTMVPFYSHVQ